MKAPARTRRRAPSGAKIGAPRPDMPPNSQAMPAFLGYADQLGVWVDLPYGAVDVARARARAEPRQSAISHMILLAGGTPPPPPLRLGQSVSDALADDQVPSPFPV